MNITDKTPKPIEVEFRDVTESENLPDVNVNKVIQNKKLSLKMVIALLQKKAKKILNNKPKTIALMTKALSFVKKLGNISFLKKHFLDVPKLCDMLSDVINGIYKNIPYASIIVVLVAIIYMVSPFDFLPDAIPFAGLLDDAAILKLVINTIKNDLDSYSSWKNSIEATE